MEVYPYVVSGYELDGTEHTATLKLHGSETFDFKYTASTDNEFAEALKSFLTGHSFTDWSAYIKDGEVYLQYDNYTSAEYLSASITQATGIRYYNQIVGRHKQEPECNRRRYNFDNESLLVLHSFGCRQWLW